MVISKAVEKMAAFYDGNLHDVNHFIKVWAYARTIGEMENTDEYTMQTLELAAIAHDIACPLCRKKYGRADGANQEKEGIALTEEFYKDMGISKEQIERICYLVGHHHTVSGVDGADYQILLEADFLVNADESNMTKDAIKKFRDKVFKTKTGIRLLNQIYQL